MRLGVGILLILICMGAGYFAASNVIGNKVERLESLANRQTVIIERGSEEIAGLKRIIADQEEKIQVKDSLFIQISRKLHKCQADLSGKTSAKIKPEPVIKDSKSKAKPVFISNDSELIEEYKESNRRLEDEVDDLRRLLTSYAYSEDLPVGEYSYEPESPDPDEIPKAKEQPAIDLFIMTEDVVKYRNTWGPAFGPAWNVQTGEIDASTGLWWASKTVSFGGDWFWKQKMVNIRVGWNLNN